MYQRGSRVMIRVIKRILLGSAARLRILTQTSLAEIASVHYSKDDITRKPIDYFIIYESILGQFATADIKILELGVFNGASLAVWRRYFKNAVIVGLDVDPLPEKLAPLVSAGQLYFVQGDQSNHDVLDRAIKLTGGSGFDIIIDDASHIGALSKASFDYLFLNGLKPNGYYFVEDYGTGYMAGFPDGAAFAEPVSDQQQVFPSHQFGMVGWMKQLIDEIHRSAITPDHQSRYPIESITFWPHIALVRKVTKCG